MKTIKEIRDRIAKIQDEIKDCWYPVNDETKRLSKAIGVLEDRKDKIVEELRKKSIKKADKLWEEKSELKGLLEKMSRRKEDGVSEKVLEWFRAYVRHLEGGEKYKVVWVSADEKYLIYQAPGGTSWCGRGETKYYPSTYILVDVGRSHWISGGLADFEGRATKEKMVELIAKIPKK